MLAKTFNVPIFNFHCTNYFGLDKNNIVFYS